MNPARNAASVNQRRFAHPLRSHAWRAIAAHTQSVAVILVKRSTVAPNCTIGGMLRPRRTVRDQSGIDDRLGDLCRLLVGALDETPAPGQRENGGRIEIAQRVAAVNQRYATVDDRLPVKTRMIRTNDEAID